MSPWSNLNHMTLPSLRVQASRGSLGRLLEDKLALNCIIIHVPRTTSRAETCRPETNYSAPCYSRRGQLAQAGPAGAEQTNVSTGLLIMY